MKYPLTSAQRMFYTEIITDSLPLWNHGFYIIFDGQKTEDELSGVINRLTVKNQIFRMSFSVENDNPVQHINEYKERRFELLDFKDRSELESFAENVVNSPALICEDPLKWFIFTLPDKYGFFLCVHHILCDGLSVPILIDKIKRELGLLKEEAKIYEYSAHIEEELLYRKSPRFDKNIAFWNRELSGRFENKLFGEISFSADYSACEEKYTLSSESLEKARKYCEEENIPFSAFIYAAFAVYVKKTMGLNDFSVGMPTLNRNREDDLHTLGLYMHNLPLIIHMKNESDFSSLLEDVYDSIISLIKNQKFTQTDIQNCCSFEKRGEQLFDAVIDYQNQFDSSDCECEVIYSKYISLPLELHFTDKKDGSVDVVSRYRESVLSKKDVETIINGLSEVTEAFSENPKEKISDFKIKESQPSIVSGEKIQFDLNSTVYSLFEKNALKNSDKVCITDESGDITYGEFFEMTKKLDSLIRKKCGDKKQIIGVYCERSPEMYLSVYAAVRGGNAYMPIDVSQPSKRTEYMIEKSNVSLVLGQGKFREKIKNADFIDVTEFISKSDEYEYNSVAASLPGDTAYVIYTSGTTGKPKGAMISNLSIVNRINWMNRKYPTNDKSVILQKTPYTFDVSVWEILWWGMFGGKLAFSEPDEHFLPEKIIEKIARFKVTHIHFVPSVFSLFLEYIEKNDISLKKLESLRYIFLSGEALSASLVDRFNLLFSKTETTLHNLYGPTECAVDVTYYDCDRNHKDIIPIGRPVDNTSLYILDEKMNPVPCGCEGEIYIGGMNVGAGYINDKKLTEASFIESAVFSDRLYKTGDIGYLNDEGQIVFCGRKDTQIKINGQRVETDEIENIIASADGVSAAVVMMKKVNGKNSLTAFYSGETEKTEELKKRCQKNLPGYMVPADFIHLTEIPVNRNGKADRKLLEEYNNKKELTEISESGKPENETEKIICDLFSEILNIKNVNRFTDFISEGGSSLDIIKFVSDNRFKEITVKDFISDPTPSGICQLMNKKRVSRFVRLSQLKNVEGCDKSVIIFPFAGGSAASFAGLSEKLFSELNASVYFADFPDSLSGCEVIAQEISELSKFSKIAFYGHCVGAHLAFIIATLLEERGVSISGIVAAGYIPGERNRKLYAWNFIPDNIIRRILSASGADFSSLPEKYVSDIIKGFKRDTAFIADNDIGLKVEAKIKVLLAEDDLFTRNNKHPLKSYKKLFDNVDMPYLFMGGNHYFQTEKTDLIVETIKSVFRN